MAHSCYLSGHPYSRHNRHDHKANGEAEVVYYTVMKHFGHLRTLDDVENTRPRLVFSLFPSFPQIPFVFYHRVMNGLGFFIC